jgi:hypothetical protein
MFRAPPPGTPKTAEPEAGRAPGHQLEDLHDAEARANFRVGVILPEEVERVELKDLQRARRVLYTLKDGQWAEEELWP